MRFFKFSVAILVIMCACLLAGCGGGSDLTAAGVPEYKVGLMQPVITRGGDGPPQFVELQMVDGVYQADAGNEVVPYVTPNLVTRGGPNQVFTIVNTDTGEKTVITETPESQTLPDFVWVPGPGSYLISAKLLADIEKEVVPARLVVR